MQKGRQDRWVQWTEEGLRNSGVLRRGCLDSLTIHLSKKEDTLRGAERGAEQGGVKDHAGEVQEGRGRHGSPWLISQVLPGSSPNFPGLQAY